MSKAADRIRELEAERARLEREQEREQLELAAELVDEELAAARRSLAAEESAFEANSNLSPIYLRDAKARVKRLAAAETWLARQLAESTA